MAVLHMEYLSFKESINIISLLKKTERGRKVVNSYIERNEDYITNEERIDIVKSVCQHIVQNDPLKYYRSTETKQLYAASIVKSFPCLATKNQDGQGKVEISHDVYFHPQAGDFIENHLKEIRRRDGRKSQKKETEQQGSFNY